MRFLLIIAALTVCVWAQAPDLGPIRFDAVPSAGGVVNPAPPFSISATDNGRVLLLSNPTAFDVAIGQAGTGGFVAPWFVDVTCVLAACTIRPEAGAINGATSYTVAAGQQVRISVLGSEYVTAGTTPAANGWSDDGNTVSTTRDVTAGLVVPDGSPRGTVAARKLYGDTMEANGASLNTLRPAADPELSVTGETGTNWGYKVSDVLASGTTGLPSVEVIISGPSVLDASNYITITHLCQPNGTYWTVWRTVAEGTPSTKGKAMASTKIPCTTTTVDDTGWEGDGSKAPTSNNTGLLIFNNTGTTPMMFGWLFSQSGHDLWGGGMDFETWDYVVASDNTVTPTRDILRFSPSTDQGLLGPGVGTPSRELSQFTVRVHPSLDFIQGWQNPSGGDVAFVTKSGEFQSIRGDAFDTAGAYFTGWTGTWPIQLATISSDSHTDQFLMLNGQLGGTYAAPTNVGVHYSGYIQQHQGSMVFGFAAPNGGALRPVFGFSEDGGNILDFYKADGTIPTYIDVNGRMVLPVVLTTEQFNVGMAGEAGQIRAQAALDTTHTGFIGWYKADNTRTAYLGYDSGNDLTLNMANGIFNVTTYVNAMNGYKVNGTTGWTGTKQMGTCNVTITGGIITDVTGC